MKRFPLFATGALFLGVVACNDNATPDGPDTPSTPPVPSLGYSVVKTYAHDTANFTEGLEFYKGTLLESTGPEKKSKLVQTEKGSDKIIRSIKLDDKYFGEGLTVLNDTLYQLTYREHTVLVYTAKDFRKIKELPLNGEGWGLTNDGKYLIASNGSTDLFYYEPGTFKLVKTLTVSSNGAAVANINELEYVDGFIYANQWQFSYIIKIDANTGNVVGRMDLSNLVDQSRREHPGNDFLNGIAYDAENKSLHITGKYWPKVYEIKIN